MTLDQPDLEACVLSTGREGFRLVAPWSYTWHHGAVTRRLCIEAGFEHDGASVPRLLWTCLGLTPAGLVSAAALAHDWLYRHSGRFQPRSLWERPEGSEGWIDVSDFLLCTRKEADRLFARIMREAGVPRVRRRLAYLGVRMGGWWLWQELR